MKYCDFTGKTPEENLACDDALLELCESGAEEAILRLWEPATRFVVLGYAGRMAEEVHAGACRRLRLGVFRRASGGGTVVQGPGCLNYAVAIRHDGQGPFAGLRSAMAHVLERHRQALEALLGVPIERAGLSDLAIAGRKCSGNAQRRKRRAALVHGTFLLAFDLPLIEAALRMPPRQPPYRHGRAHAEFLTNVPVPASRVRRALRQVWHARGRLASVPSALIHELAHSRHASRSWIDRLS